jgi:hypothetical protein
MRQAVCRQMLSAEPRLGRILLAIPAIIVAYPAGRLASAALLAQKGLPPIHRQKEEILMKFSSFLWQNFVESSQGRESIAFFHNLQARYEKRDEQLRRFIEHWSASGMIGGRTNVDEEIESVVEASALLAQATQEKWLPAGPIDTIEDAEAYFREGVAQLTYTDDPGENPHAEPKCLFELYDVPALSIALYCLHPRFFFPYFFYPRFYALKKLFEEFGIFLPPVPPKSNYDARFHYYFELCRSFHQFADQHGLTGELAPAFLYGFAPQALGLDDSSPTDLLLPRRAWFVGGGVDQNGDFEYLDRVTKSSQTIWQGNADTEPGDIVVMYCLTPRSCVHSFWRALRFGAVEPFRYFYNTIWIGHPQLVKPISLSEMRNDPVLSSMPLVRGNMQGINGRVVTKPYYDRLLDLLREKGMDTSILPQLEEVEPPDVVLHNERDVELKLLEPLLRALGFQASDWTRQMSLQVGRGEKVIPDYAILPVESPKGGATQAAWVWEAKLSVPTYQQLCKDLEQVASYGRLVSATGVSLISREGMWMSLSRDGFALAKGKYWSSAQLRSPDSIAEIRAIAGKHKLSRH